MLLGARAGNTQGRRTTREAEQSPPRQGFNRKRLPSTQQHLSLQLLNHKLEAHGQRQGSTSLPN